MISAPILITAYGVWAFAFSGPDQRLLLNPVFLSAAVVIAMIEHFWRRDHQLPIADVGTLCALITLVYVAVPTIFYIKAGLTFTQLSDRRLVLMGTTPADVADFLWWAAAYIVALVTSYSLLRGPGMPGPQLEINTGPNAGWALVAIVALTKVYQIAIGQSFGLNLDPSNWYLQMELDQLPRLVGQITHNVLAIGLIATLGVIAYVFARRSLLLGVVLAAWLLLVSLPTLLTIDPINAQTYFPIGSRTYATMLILGIILSRHRISKPIGAVLASTTAIALLVVLIGYGIVRTPRVADFSDIWVVSNEFQVLMANGINVAWEKARGNFHDIPWQITYNDLVLMIPQQLLPFAKLDTSRWYLQQIGNLGENMSPSMFGVVAQSRLGFGLPEIIIRGAVLGAVLAFIHRQCVKHADSLTSFIIYLWLCTSIYYTYRASTFYIATWAIYRVVPFVLLFWLFRSMFRPRQDIAPAPDVIGGRRAID